MSEKALKCGITHMQTKGRLNKWITSMFFKNANANNIRIYGANVYIFCSETPVTVIPVPENIKKDVEKMIRR